MLMAKIIKQISCKNSLEVHEKNNHHLICCWMLLGNELSCHPVPNSNVAARHHLLFRILGGRPVMSAA